ncbi:hypothetical protein ZOD2009_03992 [Haladaptatus paucihalophilus DX253]|uniref:Uncharacterized protein n=1 Tax=Haladaptatus paucihalophilus DX253 TaxID=797209 RepID=E7QPP1_HALPU|nr:hypothetical protein [Haladaptatus paucihalophilus]EFW93543.1 hypothetical protein ZOD2009_03992 [Haladaptatus paucihalophilus DX253]SHL21835.1 hypothetical protein SAMN05444342_3310 [Haladaptatus paucihalophilus DX253]
MTDADRPSRTPVDSGSDTDDQRLRPTDATTRGIVLLVVLSFGIVPGVLSGAPSSPSPPTETVADSCSAPSDNGVLWHLQRYGAGCERNDFVRFPAGEQIDRIGEPPWVPL